MQRILLSTLLCTLFFALSASAQDKGADPAAIAYKNGKAAYQKGDHSSALTFFTDAYNLSGKPDLLYNMAICNEKLGENTKAIAFYQLYLEEKPDASDAESVKKTIERLSGPPPAEPAAVATATPAPVEKNKPESAPAPLVETGPSVEEVKRGEELVAAGEKRRKYRIAQGLLIGGGSLLALSGMITGIAAYEKYNSYEATCAPDCESSKADEVRALTVTTDVLLFTGLAVAAGGLIWLLVDVHREKKGETLARSETFNPIVGLSPAGVSLGGKF